MLIGYDSESKKITGLITLFQKLKYESKGITSDVVMGFRNLSVESLKTKEIDGTRLDAEVSSYLIGIVVFDSSATKHIASDSDL